MNISEDLKTILLAGIGAAAVTAEKSKEMIDTFVSKGELTVEQGRVLNEELHKKVAESRVEAEKTVSVVDSKDSLIDKVEKLSAEERAELKAKLEEMDKAE